MQQWTMDPSAVISYSVALCLLALANVATWGAIAWAFWREQVVRHRRGFFTIVVIMVSGYMLTALGTLATRAMNVTRYYGLTPALQELTVSRVAHWLQLVMMVAMLLGSLAILLLIWHRKRSEQHGRRER